MNYDLRSWISLGETLRSVSQLAGFALLVSAIHCTCATGFAFEGHISATVVRGGETQTFLYTVGTNELRVERGETDRPYAKDIVNLDTGDITLVYPHNRSFVRLEASTPKASAPPPGLPAMPSMPVGVGPLTQNIGPTNLAGMPVMAQMPAMPASPNRLPPGIGPQAGNNSPAPGMPQMPSGMPAMPQMPSGMGAGMSAGMPSMPMMPRPMMESIELKAIGGKTNLLGFLCERYEIKQRDEVMEIWATDQLLPFQPYLPSQPPRFGPRMVEEQWSELLRARKLFPLLAVLRQERSASTPGGTPVAGPERLRFEVKSVTPGKITDDALFQPPPDYQEVRPLPF